MDITKNDRKKQKLGPIVAALVMILLMFALILIFLWGDSVDPIPPVMLVFFMAFPSVVIIGVLLALKERFKEIEGGEEHEAAKY